MRARSRGTRNAILTVWGAVAVSAGVYWVTCAVINGVPEDGKPGSPLATAAAAAIDIKPRTKPASELRPKPRSSQLYAAASGIAAAHNALANAAPSALRVDTVAAVLRPMPRYLTLTGTLTADLESNVAADAAGKVLEVSVDRGSNVQTGDILVVLDRRAADINSREATAAVEIARVHSELARTNCARADALLKQGAIGQVDYDRAKSECTATQLAVAAAQSRRAAALKSLDDALIRAPFAGVVSERFVEPGEYVQPQSQVAHLVASDPLRLRMSVPEQLVGSIETDMLVELQVAAHAERWFAGKVRYLSAALREDTRDLIVEAEVPNPEQQLRPGMFAVARVVLPKHPVTAVPEASLRYDGELARLFVAQAGHLEERIVELGTRDAQWVEIRRGVALGEAVVSPFSLEAKDGTPVAQ